MATNNALNISLSGQSGTGAIAGTVSPSFTTPALGTPSALVLTNATGDQLGVTNNSAAVAGHVGELIQSIRASGSPLSLTTNTAADVTSIALTAGDWDLYGNINIVAASVGASLYIGWISSVSASAPDASLYNGIATAGLVLSSTGIQVPFATLQLNGNTTVYLSALATFADTLSVCGGLYARRVR